jgi:4'-phosphopantetheinyl transferase
MPYLSLDINETIDVALWHITEGEEELKAMVHPEVCPSHLISHTKRLEWMAARALLRRAVEASHLVYKGVTKDEFGKPYLSGHNTSISLTHSFPYVAVQIGHHYTVGIDLEQPKEKLFRIAPRIMSPTELADAGDNLVKHCVYWCAKEALYKIHGKRGLLFSNHLQVEPFQLGTQGDLVGVIALDGIVTKRNLGYLIKDDYVLVFTKPLSA